MNAYEIADELDGRLDHKAANMLRKQADRIAELEDRLSMYEIKDLDRGIIGRTKDYAIHDLVHRTTPQIKELSDRELVVFLMDEIDRASEWLVDGETHMAIGVLGQCHAKIRKHLSNTKESE